MSPRDLLVAVYLFVHPRATTVELSNRLRISRSQAFSALKALRNASLVSEGEVIRGNALEFLLHGVRYVFPVKPGEEALGVPTGISSPLFPSESARVTPLVWPSPIGIVRGPSVTPLWRTVPDVVGDDPRLHRLLAAIDAVRCGRARDREFAVGYLTSEFSHV